MRARPLPTNSSATGLRCPPDGSGTLNSATERRIAGICGLFGVYTPIPAWIWRTLFLALLLCGGIGLAVYLIVWLCLPASSESG